MLQRAVEFLDGELVAAQISTQSEGRITLEGILQQRKRLLPYSPDVRLLLALTSRNRRNGWYKSLTKFEILAGDIVGPNFRGNGSRIYGTNQPTIRMGPYPPEYDLLAFRRGTITAPAGCGRQIIADTLTMHTGTKL